VIGALLQVIGGVSQVIGEAPYDSPKGDVAWLLRCALFRKGSAEVAHYLFRAEAQDAEVRFAQGFWSPLGSPKGGWVVIDGYWWFFGETY